MNPVLTAAEMREADRHTIEAIGMPGSVLMENAGAGVERAIRRRFAHPGRMVVLCGKGNNGGDGFVVARRLRDLSPETYLLGTRCEVKGDARLHLDVWERSGGTVQEIAEIADWNAVRTRVVTADIVVDALLGTGLDREPSGLIAQVIQDVAERGPRGVVAVDLPSGVPSDSGAVDWPTVSAQLTVTFAARKHGHVLPPACDRIGELVVVDIGIPDALISGARLFQLETADAARAFPPRVRGAHKGSYGHLLLIAGGVGKTGAAVLAASAALRTGAGLVTVATAAPALPLVAMGRAEAMTEPLASTGSGTIALAALEASLALAETRDAVVIGPGLGRHQETRDFVRAFLKACAKPVLVDADGLNALVSGGDSSPNPLLRRAAPTILTPHPGEMARLIGRSVGEVQCRRLEVARALAVDSGATVVLKGRGTIVARKDGRAAVSPTGNPGMATGGTGDVLSGMIGALLARGCEEWVATTAGVFLHGLAGDRAAASKGEEALIAGDMIEALPETLRSVATAAGSE